MPKKKQTKGIKKLQYHYSRARKRPSIKFVQFIIFAAVFVWLGHFLFPTHALTYPYENSTAKSADLSNVNSYRSSKGYPVLSGDRCLDAIAGNHARSEATYHSISEPTTSWLSSQFNTYCTGRYWLALGANDGVGPTEYSTFKGFLGSCPHLANIIDHGTPGTYFYINTACYNPSNNYYYDGVTHHYRSTSAGYNHVGADAYVGSDGNIYICEIFARW